MLILIASSVAGAQCDDLLEPIGVQRVLELIESAEHDHYLITVNNENNLVIVVKNFRAREQANLELLLEDTDLNYEILNFFRLRAYHIKR